MDMDDKDRNQKDLRQRGMENQVKGKGENLKGRIKDAAGSLTGNEKMEAEGKWDRLKGSVRDTAGDIQRRIGKDQSERDRT
jgi:uncharacterized protein YjbJ (UPF0337 family)